MNLLQVYECMLKQAGFEVDDDGFVYTVLSGERRPAMVHLEVDGEPVSKRLVLPTNTQLKAGTGWDNRIAFHPLKENVISGESKIIEYLRHATIVRANMVFRTLIEQILNYGLSFNQANSKAIKKVDSEKIKLLDLIKDADQTTLDNFNKIMKQVAVTNMKSGFVSIFLKKMGKIKNTSYSCVGKINFPFYRDLQDVEKTFHGVKNLRKKDIETYKKIIEFIYPDINDELKCQVGVNESIAPFAEALVMVTDKLGQELNRVADLVLKDSGIMPQDEAEALLEHMRYTNDHVEAFSHLDDLLGEIRSILLTEGNESPNSKSIQQMSEVKDEKVSASKTSEDRWGKVEGSNMQPQMQTQMVMQPVYDQWGRIIGQQPVQMPVPMQPNMTQQPGMMPQAMPQQQVNQQPKVTNGEVDISSMPWAKRNVPMYPMVTGVPQPQVPPRMGALSMNQMQMQQQMAPPWVPMQPGMVTSPAMPMMANGVPMQPQMMPQPAMVNPAIMQPNPNFINPAVPMQPQPMMMPQVNPQVTPFAQPQASTQPYNYNPFSK